jgi:hypothetical protein
METSAKLLMLLELAGPTQTIDESISKPRFEIGDRSGTRIANL